MPQQRHGFPVRNLILTIEYLIAPKHLSLKFEFSDDRVLFGRGDGHGYFVLAEQYDPNDAERRQQRSPASLPVWFLIGNPPGKARSSSALDYC